MVWILEDTKGYEGERLQQGNRTRGVAMLNRGVKEGPSWQRFEGGKGKSPTDPGRTAFQAKREYAKSLWGGIPKVCEEQQLAQWLACSAQGRVVPDGVGDKEQETVPGPKGPWKGFSFCMEQGEKPLQTRSGEA